VSIIDAMSDIEIEKLLESHKGELKSIADAAGKGERDKVVDGVTALAVTIATGSPVAGALAPLARRAVAKAFGNSVNEALDRELAELKQQGERQKFLGHIDEVMAALIGQALVQIIRSQHNVNDEVIEALGGLRSDFEAFRNDFGKRLAREGEATVRIDEQLVQGRSIGVRVRATTTKRVVLKRQVVDGGSTGILLD